MNQNQYLNDNLRKFFGNKRTQNLYLERIYQLLGKLIWYFKIYVSKIIKNEEKFFRVFRYKVYIIEKGKRIWLILDLLKEIYKVR